VRTGDEREIDPAEVTVVVDGHDVTRQCAVRLPRVWPANRADYEYRPEAGWAPGLHEVSVALADTPRRSWRFEVPPGDGSG
jgi:hypothetical protein